MNEPVLEYGWKQSDFYISTCYICTLLIYIYISLYVFMYDTYIIRSILKIVIFINSYQQFTIRSEISNIHTEILQLGDSIPEHVSQ